MQRYNLLKTLLFLSGLSLLSACDNSSNSADQSESYSIGGTVSGLSGSGLVLQNNAGDDLSVNADGSFSFAAVLVDGSAYSVVVLSQPGSPSQMCTVTNGSGSLAGAAISNVSVVCINTYNIGGSVSGLTGSGLVFQNNAGDDLAISNNGSFTFAVALIDGSSYSVTVSSQPGSPAQTCITTNASGILAGADITNVSIDCYDDPTVAGVARFRDGNFNGLADAGDTIIVPFSEAIIVNSTDAANFTLPVSGSTFGSGATLAAGPALNEATITLGSNPRLKTRGDFDSSDTTFNAPSGIDVSVSLDTNSIEHDTTGTDAIPALAIDLISTFIDSGQSLGSLSTYSVLPGDVDSDGDLDMITANFSGGARVWLNDGTGNLSDSGQALASGQSLGAALGDVDGDGDLDMVTGNVNGGANQVWLNNGSGIFSDSGQALGANDTYAVTLGDIDNDGDLDLVAGNSGANRVWVNNGSGSFTDSGQSLSTQTTYDVTLGDLDADGDLDLVAGNSTGGIKIWVNNGSGAFSDSGQALQLPGSSATNAVTLGDVDGDGDLDLAAGNASGQSNRIWLNDGSAVFNDSGQNLGNSTTYAVAFSDVDSDGDVDLVTANMSGQASRLWLNDGNGLFNDSGQALNNGDTRDIALRDMDGDGDIDLVTGNSSSQSNRVYYGSLSGTWGSARLNDSSQSNGSGNNRAVVVGDVDGDGDLDVVSGNFSGVHRIWLNDGKGAYSNSGQSLGSNNTEDIALGDVDGDGDLDLVVANGIFSGVANQVWLNDGSGVYSNSGQALGARYTVSVALGDMDNDGDLDIVAGNRNGDRTQLWLNDGNGTFSGGQSFSFSEVTDVSLGDLDDDGDLDIVLGNTGFTANHVWLNNGSATFTKTGQNLGNSVTNAIALGDVDGDGDLDMVAGNSKSNKLWLNSGNGNFSNSGQNMGVFENTQDIALADLDGDGDLDLVAGNEDGVSNDTSQLWVNNGSGIFSNEQSLGSHRTNAVALGDLDGDGDVDLVVGNINQGNRVYLNQ